MNVLLVPAHPGFPGQIPQSRKTVVVVVVVVRYELLEPLNILFQLSYKLGKLPEEWKVGHIMAVYKKGNKSDPSNYRPISNLYYMQNNGIHNKGSYYEIFLG